MGVFAYYDTETDGTVYHVIPSPESESTPSSVYSETESSPSGVTIESDDMPGYFVLHHGRQHPADDQIAKWFPSDNIRRYTIQYLIMKHIFGGDYVGPVKEMLAPVQGRERQALELGTRTGTWIQAMATQFPHVQFRSVDVIPMMPHIPRQGLTLENKSQDVVFLNHIMELTRDYRALLREVYRVLRPGGLIYINDFNPGIWDRENVTLHARRTNPIGCHLLDLVRQRISSFGVDPDTCDKLPEWLAQGSDVWTEGQGGFKEIESIIPSFPAYPHDGFSCMDSVEPKMVPYFRHIALMSGRDFIGLLKDLGMKSEEAEKLIEDTIEELKRHEGCAMFKGYCIHAIKN
ncbi:methyltransferase domain protein [Ceratobasidium sp. AG-Ba]|nr:methyltransferase domain protein [Ceratobasidium sp. AG-Ba]